MTIVNVACWPDHALVGADSVMCRDGCALVVDHKGAPILDRKLEHLQAARCILAVVGALRLRHHMRDTLHDARGLEDIVNRAPRILRGAPPHVTATVRTRYPDDNTLLVVGWSAHHGSMAVCAFVASRGYEPELHVPPAGGAAYWYSPSIPLPAFYFYPMDAAGMLGLAELQVAHFRGRHADAPIGGPFTVATLTRDVIAFEVAGDLGLPEASCDRSGSPHYSLPPVAEETPP